MAVNETIKSGFYRVWNELEGMWNRYSFKGLAKDTVFDDGNDAETKHGAINGITSSLVSNDDTVAASAAAVCALNNNLGGNILTYDESEDAFYIQNGADSVPKKLGSIRNGKWFESTTDVTSFLDLGFKPAAICCYIPGVSGSTYITYGVYIDGVINNCLSAHNTTQKGAWVSNILEGGFTVTWPSNTVVKTGTTVYYCVVPENTEDDSPVANKYGIVISNYTLNMSVSSSGTTTDGNTSRSGKTTITLDVSSYDTLYIGSYTTTASSSHANGAPNVTLSCKIDETTVTLDKTNGTTIDVSEASSVTLTGNVSASGLGGYYSSSGSITISVITIV